MTDLSKSFNKLIGEVFVKINGHTCERLPGGKFKWMDKIGTREEIEKAIEDAKENLQNSLNKRHEK